jgi:hypothetical protein
MDCDESEEYEYNSEADDNDVPCSPPNPGYMEVDMSSVMERPQKQSRWVRGAHATFNPRLSGPFRKARCCAGVAAFEGQPTPIAARCATRAKTRIAMGHVVSSLLDSAHGSPRNGGGGGRSECLGVFLSCLPFPLPVLPSAWQRPSSHTHTHTHPPRSTHPPTLPPSQASFCLWLWNDVGVLVGGVEGVSGFCSS